jgi:hypothetical protein
MIVFLCNIYINLCIIYIWLSRLSTRQELHAKIGQRNR